MVRSLLALSFPLLLSAQSADFSARISTGPYDAQKRIHAVVEVEAKAPLRGPGQVKLDILGSFIEQNWVTSPGVTCSKDGENWLRCTLPSMPAGSKASVSFDGLPWLGAGRRSVIANLQWTDGGFRTERRSWEHEIFDVAHEFVVTNTADAGPGSFRQAIEDAKPLCVEYQRPCRIRFDLAAPAVIHPLTPLPEVEGISLLIDGESKVTLDGSLLTVPASGVDLGGHSIVFIHDLAIESFPANGVLVSEGQTARLLRCAITKNGSRGVAMDGLGSLAVEDSVISGNGRSGVFALGGGGSVIRSLIGVAADGITPMPNGASGIFADGYSWTILDNVIAYNAHWGVATHANNHYVDIGRNRIVGNAFGPIDIGLDGPSFFSKPADGSFYFPPNGPTLLAATYDPAADATTVTGRLDGVPFFYFLTYEIQFWATTAANEADDFLGAISIEKPDFTVKFRGDLRGRYVTANTIRYVHDEITDRGPSELSAPIEVR